MPDGASLGIADPDPQLPAELAPLINRILSDPVSGPYDQYVASVYGRGLASGRADLPLQLGSYFDAGVIGPPLLGAAAAQLPAAQLPSITGRLSIAISQYLDLVLLGQRIAGSPGSEAMKSQPPEPAVLMYRGEFTYRATDLQVLGAGMDFAFRRLYRNQVAYSGPLGANWDHSFNIRLTEVDLTRLVMTTGALGEETYELHPIHAYYVPRPGVDAIFEAAGDSFRRRAPDGSLYVFRRVHGTRFHDLARIEDRFGNYLALTHGNDEYRLLQRIEVNHPSRVVDFEFDGRGRICRIRDFSGRNWTYCYDDLGDLVTVIAPTTGTCPVGPITQFEYRGPDVPAALQHNLYRIIDAAGRGYIENTYGELPGSLEFNRVIGQRQGGGETALEYERVAPIGGAVYSEPDLPTLQVTETRRNGSRIRHVYNAAGNLLYDEECTLRGGLPKVLQTRYRYNRDGQLVAKLTPEGLLTQYLRGREWFTRRLGIMDADAETHPALTRQERQGFARELAVVRRADVFGLLQLTGVGSPWGPFPSLVDTLPNPDDIIVKTTYEPEFGQVGTVSHPQYTSSPVPGALGEHPRHVETRTRYEYTGPLALLSRIHLPPPTDADGNAGPVWTTQLPQYDARGRLERIVDPVGTVTELRYFPSAPGPNTGWEGHLQSIEVDPGGLAVRTNYEIDVLGRMVAEHRPRATGDGRFIFRTRYDVLDRIVETVASAPFQYATQFTYDKTGNLIRRERDLVGADGVPFHQGLEVATFCYDDDFNLKRESLGGPDTAAHVVTQHCYGPSGERISTTRPNGNRNAYGYNERLQCVAMVEGAGTPDAATTRIGYDGDGRAVAAVNARGHAATSEFDSLGRIIGSTNALGHVTRRTYDKSGNVLVSRAFERRADGYYLLTRKEAAYDEQNRLIRQSLSVFDNPVGPFPLSGLTLAELSPGPGRLVSTRYFYDSMGRVTRVNDALNRATLVAYDAVGRRMKLTDPVGNETHFAYDKHGNLVRREEVDIERDPISGNETRRRFFPSEALYDELDRCILKVDGMGNSFRYGYDSRGDRTGLVDPLGNEVRFAHDIYGRTSAQASYLTAFGRGPVDSGSIIVETRFDYDPGGNLVGVVDARGNRTSYRYDALDRCRATTYPDGSQSLTDYDPDGNVIRVIEPNGVERHHRVDPLGQTTRIDVYSGAAIVEVAGATFEQVDYDACGRAVSGTNDFAQTVTKFDSLGRPVESTLALQAVLGVGQGPYTISRRYDDVGALEELTYPGGRRLWFQRDGLSRLTAIRNRSNGMGYPGDPLTLQDYELAAFQYAGRHLFRMRDGGGATSRYRYDAARRVVEMSHSGAGQALLSILYLYDGTGNVRVRQNSGTVYVGREHFAYDSLYRLVDEFSAPMAAIDPTAFEALSQAGQPITDRQSTMDALYSAAVPPQAPPAYEYDGVGNRTRLRLSEDHSYAGNTNNEIAAIVDNVSGSQVTVAYDGAGNLVSHGEHRFVYDGWGRLTQIQARDGTTTHAFIRDASGRRIAERIATGLTILITDGAHTIAEFDNGVARAHYVYGDGVATPIQMAGGGAEHYYHTDSLGSVRLMTGGQAFATEHYEYTSFGRQLPSSSANIAGNPIRFAGQRQEQGLDLYDLRAREYSPALGRFLQRDPLGQRDDINLFTYVANNPLVYADPSGTEREKVNATASYSHTDITSATYTLKGRYEYPDDVRLRFATDKTFDVGGADLVGVGAWASYLPVPGIAGGVRFGLASQLELEVDWRRAPVVIDLSLSGTAIGKGYKQSEWLARLALAGGRLDAEGAARVHVDFGRAGNLRISTPIEVKVRSRLTAEGADFEVRAVARPALSRSWQTFEGRTNFALDTRLIKTTATDVGFGFFERIPRPSGTSDPHPFVPGLKFLIAPSVTNAEDRRKSVDIEWDQYVGLGIRHRTSVIGKSSADFSASLGAGLNDQNRPDLQTAALTLLAKFGW